MSNRPTTRGLLVPACVVARILGVNVRTVRGWIRSGALAGTSLAGEAGRPRWYVYRASFDAMRRAAEGKPDPSL